MATLSDIEKILNPADPTLAGLIPIGATVAGGLSNLAGSGAAAGAVGAGADTAMKTVSDAGGQIPGITGSILQSQRDLLNPYISAGTGALDQITAGLKPGGGLADPFSYTMKDFQNDPAYQFTLGEGEKGINRIAASRGGWASPATFEQLGKFDTGLADQTYGADYSRAENTFNQNKQQRLTALQQLSGAGQSAAGTFNTDIGHAGDANIQGIEWTATQIADLQQAKADAIAAGDLGKAKAISDTLAGVANQMGGNSALKKLTDALKPSYDGTQNPATAPSSFDANGNPVYDAVPPASAPSNLSQIASAGSGLAADFAPMAGGLTGTAAAGLGALPSAASAIAAGAPEAIGGISATLPEVASVAAQSAGLGGAGTAGASEAAVTSSGGFGPAALSLISNPITIAIGALIAGAVIWHKSQSHQTADQWTGIQKKFDDQMAQISDKWASAQSTGQVTPELAQQTKDSVQQLIDTYQHNLSDFASKGKKNMTVANQAQQTAVKYYGNDYANFLGQFTA